ncbi:hypothetical protein GDO86_018567 [Hymenochirus boettgeri]|uniref:Ankyrin repeat domain-containing protein 9 n=1 Tax=Hymenochirus boettgeri TaxID=247094 RepID=A0A8T2ILT4_9PIPI|nr:hypothetical protein GDO86_018567 [Hymenochirus boettgeri]
MFSRAVEHHDPLCNLEELRSQGYFYWEEEESDQYYSPSDALLYAILYNHQLYAQYLLEHFPKEALNVPGMPLTPVPSFAHHLAVALEHDRGEIVTMILQTAKKLNYLHFYINKVSSLYLSEGKTPLHMACEYTRTDMVLILLGHGANPRITDLKGLTPLDTTLKQLQESSVNAEDKLRCLDHLLLFSTPQDFKMKASLVNHGDYWIPLLGLELYNYLIGNYPDPLGIAAMRRIIQCLKDKDFLTSIQALPLPSSLKPLPGHFFSSRP